MVRRIVQLVIGAALAGGGGYLTWLNRAQAPQLFPPNPHDAPWMLVAGLGALVVGLVAFVGGAIPERGRKLRMAEDAARREAALQTADVYYAERARAADRDWRSGDLPPEPAVRTPSPFPSETQPPETQAPETRPPESVPPSPAAAPQPAPVARPRHELSPEPVMASAAARGFPSAATLAPIPGALSEPVPPVATAAQQPAPPPNAQPVAQQAAVSMAAVAPEAPPETAFGVIRAAISANELDEADRVLSEERARLTAAGAGSEIALAELTGLAGDHAAAAGRTGAAKWLWRLALQRFGSANAMSSPAARAVSERLRLADQ